MGYLKARTAKEELYESDYLKKIKQKGTKFSKIQYGFCYLFFEMVVLLKFVFDMITVKEIYHGFLLILPFSMEKAQTKKVKRCMKKVQKIMSKYQIQELVIAEELKEKLGLETVNAIDKKIHILDGRGLIPYCIKEILEYMIQKQNGKMQLEDVYLCMKQDKPFYRESIAYLAQYFRSINIITPAISNFQKLADKLEEAQDGGMLVVSNNKKKSLKKAKWIVNFDFSQKELKKYTIYRRAILLSVPEEEYEQTGFDGIQIRKMGIDTCEEIKDFWKKHHLLPECSIESLYESLINRKADFQSVKRQMQKDDVKIIRLYGKKGPIEDKVYVNFV